MSNFRHHCAFYPKQPSVRHQFIPSRKEREPATRARLLSTITNHRHQCRCQSTTMKKLLCVVLVSSILLATVAGASSSSPTSSLSKHQAQVLGRKGRDHYHHQISKNMQQPEELLAVEVKKPTKTKAGWAVDKGEDAEEGLIDSDYSSVAMHAGSPPKPKPKHPKP